MKRHMAKWTDRYIPLSRCFLMMCEFELYPFRQNDALTPFDHGIEESTSAGGDMRKFSVYRNFVAQQHMAASSFLRSISVSLRTYWNLMLHWKCER